MVVDSKILKDYFRKLTEAYQNAKKLEGESGNVFRGRKRSISGLSEDYFAEMLSKICSEEKDMLFLVDYPVSLGKKDHIYPDILVLKKKDNRNYEIVWMIDLKTDVGYHRDNERNRQDKKRSTYVEHAEKLKENCRKVCNSGEICVKDPKGLKELLRLKAMDGLCYDMIVISANNSGKTGEKGIGKEALLDMAEKPDKNVWVLFNNLHPNRCCDDEDIEAKIQNELEINVAAWNRIMQQVKGQTP